MSRALQQPNSTWLVVPRPNPEAKLRLFCFPYSGASAAIYLRWPESLPPNIEVCAVQLPGHGTRLAEPPFRRLPALVQATAQALLPYLDLPFAFFGHSMGALLSFELARHLRQQLRLSPQHLFASGHGAPQLPDRSPPMHQLPECEFVDRLRELNGTPEEVLAHDELRQLVIPILRADFAICETYVYRPEPPLPCPISAYGGLRDRYVSHEELVAWQQQTTGAFVVRMFPGDHFYLNAGRDQLLYALARELAASL